MRDFVDSIRETIPTLIVNSVESEIMNQLSYEVSTEKFIRKTKFKFNDILNNSIQNELELINVSA